MPPKIDSLQVVDSVALATPAVRMLVIAAWWSGESGLHLSRHPVVAIQARVVRDYVRHRREPRQYDAATTRQLEAAGWHGQGHDVLYDYLIAGEEFGDGLVSDRVAFESSANVAHEAVVCPWPEAQDDDRLVGVIHRVSTTAEERGRAFEASQGKRPGKIPPAARANVANREPAPALAGP